MKKFLSIVLCLLITNAIFPEGFVAGTLVKTPHGYISIEQLKKGDQVIALSADGTLADNTVTRIHQEKVNILYEMAIDGEKICAALDHQFFSPSAQEWVDLQALKNFDTCGNQGRECVDIQSIKQISDHLETEVFTITVEPHHNFFVTHKDILVHNWAFTIPVFTWVFGGGLKVLGLKALAVLLGYQVLKEGVKHLAKKAGGDVSGFDTAGTPPMFDPDDDPENDNDKQYSKGRVSNFSRHPSTPVGRKGQKPEVKLQDGINKPTRIYGRDYTGHAIDSMQERGITPSVVENAIRHGKATQNYIPGRISHYDAINNLTVITDSLGKIITVSYGIL